MTAPQDDVSLAAIARPATPTALEEVRRRVLGMMYDAQKSGQMDLSSLLFEVARDLTAAINLAELRLLGLDVTCVRERRGLLHAVLSDTIR